MRPQEVASNLTEQIISAEDLSRLQGDPFTVPSPKPEEPSSPKQTGRANLPDASPGSYADLCALKKAKLIKAKGTLR